MVANGVITTVVGNGIARLRRRNGPASNAELNDPYAIAVDAAGNLYISDTEEQRIRKVAGGVITTVAGDGDQWFRWR